MSKISIKTDFNDGEKLFAQDLNNNFLVIQSGINSNEENLQEVIDQAIIELDKQLEEITADRGWDWNGGDRVTFFKGNDEQVTSQPIKNGQLLYNTNTGETAVDDAGKRVVTGSGNVVEINNGSTPSNPATKLWIDRNKIVKTRASQVTTSMDGDDLNMAPAVKTVKDFFRSLKTIAWTNPNSSAPFAEQSVTLFKNISEYSYYEIIYRTWRGNPHMQTSGKLPIEFGTVLNYFESSSVMAMRSIDAPSNNAVKIHNVTGNGTDNNWIVPYKIILYKEV